MERSRVWILLSALHERARLKGAWLFGHRVVTHLLGIDYQKATDWWPKAVWVMLILLLSLPVGFDLNFSRLTPWKSPVPLHQGASFIFMFIQCRWGLYWWTNKLKDSECWTNYIMGMLVKRNFTFRNVTSSFANKAPPMIVKSLHEAFLILTWGWNQSAQKEVLELLDPGILL